MLASFRAAGPQTDLTIPSLQVAIAALGALVMVLYQLQEDSRDLSTLRALVVSREQVHLTIDDELSESLAKHLQHCLLSRLAHLLSNVDM
jgi:hypothetical protein